MAYESNREVYCKVNISWPFMGQKKRILSVIMPAVKITSYMQYIWYTNGTFVNI